MLSDSEERCPSFFLIFPSVPVKDFQNVLRFQRVITLRHSVGFQCHLVHGQTTLSPTSCSQIYMTRSFSFCTILVFLKKWHFADYTMSIGL